ncbi:MAG: rhodanese-like domain-containing protein [Nitrospirae bacterium]|nr:rhodanese-like domain-containing protein [Nitrospirota bacterium]
MKKILSVLVALSILLIAGHALATDTPMSYQGITVVDADWVKTNMGKVKVYDARKKGEYVEKHIPGAISAYYNDKSEKKLDFDVAQDEWDIKKYPADKNASVVIYCNGPQCWKSFKTAIMLVKAGYTKVHWLRDGFQGWVDKGYPTE